MLDDDVDDHGTGAVESCLNKACSIAVMSLSLEVVVSCNEEKLPTHHSGPTLPKIVSVRRGFTCTGAPVVVRVHAFSTSSDTDDCC